MGLGFQGLGIWDVPGFLSGWRVQDVEVSDLGLLKVDSLEFRVIMV